MSLKIWQYRIHSSNGEGWAEILIREDGFFATVSDYGNYAYRWSSTGKKDVREFFLRAGIYWHYFANKLDPTMVLNAEASFKSVLRDILRDRRDKSITKYDARIWWNHTKEYASDEDWEGFLRDQETYEYFPEPWVYTVREYRSDVVMFAKVILPKLAKLIETEMKSEGVIIPEKTI